MVQITKKGIYREAPSGFPELLIVLLSPGAPLFSLDFRADALEEAFAVWRADFAMGGVVGVCDGGGVADWD